VGFVFFSTSSKKTQTPPEWAGTPLCAFHACLQAGTTCSGVKPAEAHTPHSNFVNTTGPISVAHVATAWVRSQQPGETYGDNHFTHYPFFPWQNRQMMQNILACCDTSVKKWRKRNATIGINLMVMFRWQREHPARLPGILFSIPHFQFSITFPRAHESMAAPDYPRGPSNSPQ
jgi:hypothetical protein